MGRCLGPDPDPRGGPAVQRHAVGTQRRDAAAPRCAAQVRSGDRPRLRHRRRAEPPATVPPSPTAEPLLRSIFVLVLVQVIFFDFEQHLILDRVMFPAMALALVVSLSPLLGGGLGLWRQDWWVGIVMGLAAGLLFLLLSLAGSAIFKAEALGFGDVKLAVFMGLLLGWPYTLSALFYGVLLAAIGAIVFIVTHRSLKGTIAYGPYLALGALLVLLQLP